MRGDRDLFRPLLRAQLRMSLRGRASQAFAGELAGRPLGVAWLFLMYVGIGATTLPVVLGGADVFTYALVTQLLTWTMCGLSLTAEAGDALFAPQEPDVIGHRPVPAVVVLAAKIAVLFGFACVLALAQNALPTAAIAWRTSAWAALVHVATVTFAVALMTVVVTLVYGICARLVPRARFDDVAAWSQIGLAILFASLAILTPRSTLRTGGLHVDPGARLLVAVPPAWFAGLETLLATGARTVVPLAGAAVVSLAGLVLLGRAAVLRRLATAIAHVQEERGIGRVRRLPAVTRWPLRGWLRDPVERAAFTLATAYLRRDRDVRLRLRPSLVVFALVPLAGLAVKQQEGGLLAPLAAACLLGMLPGVALEALRISSEPAASELFATAPLAGTAVFHGVRKAALWYVAPALVVAGLLSAAVVPAGLPLAAPGLFAVPLLSQIPGLFGPYVPLARAKIRGGQAVSNAVLLGVSTALLSVLVNATLLASRRGHLLALDAGALFVLLAIDLLVRAVVGRRAAIRPPRVAG